MISIRVPSRICFYGDHQDYLGLPVIAGTINRFIELSANPIADKHFEIHLKDLNAGKKIPLDTSFVNVDQGDYFRSGMAILRNKGFVFEKGYQVTISGNIPLNAGLSSSSALVVAWIRFLISTQENIQFTDEEIGHLAYEAEVTFFKQPGGLMDQYTIAQGGLLYIDTQTGKAEKLTGNFGKLVVAESGIQKQTLDVLKNARVYQERAINEVLAQNSEFDIHKATPVDYEKYKDCVSDKYKAYWFAAVFNYHTTKKAKFLLSLTNSDIRELSYLMNQHQAILENQIGNTPEKMKEMIRQARNAGSTAAKIIGSGGGGCMVAMVDEENMQKVIEAFIQAGAKDAYEVELVNL